MGAQAYQERVTARATAALDEVSPDAHWRTRRLVIRSLRSSLPGNRRLPLGFLAEASPRVRREAGRVLFGRDTVSHRMNLELPPSPHADVVTLHDIVAWRFDDESPPVAAAADELRAAAQVICVSAFTANEAAELLKIDDARVVHNGVDDRFFGANPLTMQARRDLGVVDRYVLHSGGASRRKNLDALAAAWPRVRRERPDLSLMLTGPEHPRRTALFAGMEGVVMTGRVADVDMPAIIAGATTVVIPSLYEGFGLPALEAMAAGVPVVAADTSALPEVIGTAGILVPPTADGVMDGLLASTSADSALDGLIEAGRERAGLFTWDRCAREHAAVWASLG